MRSWTFAALFQFPHLHRVAAGLDQHEDSQQATRDNSHSERTVVLAARPRRSPRILRFRKQACSRSVSARIEPRLVAYAVGEPSTCPTNRQVDDQVKVLVERRRGGSTLICPNVGDGNLDVAAVVRRGGIVPTVEETLTATAGDGNRQRRLELGVDVRADERGRPLDRIGVEVVGERGALRLEPPEDVGLCGGKGTVVQRGPYEIQALRRVRRGVPTGLHNLCSGSR